MNRNHFLKALLIVSVGLLLVGCATPKKTAPTFNAINLNPMLQGGDYVPRADNFMVILDKSGSMGGDYKGQKKLDYAKSLVCRMNQTIPDLNLKGSLRTFGRRAVFCDQFTDLLWGPATYSQAELKGALGKVDWSRGESPLNLALEAAGQDLKFARGDIAVIILTDANKEVMNYKAVQKAAKALKAQYGGRLCMYPVQIGKDAAGKKLLEQLAQEGRCGFYINADQIESNRGMADFVASVFLQKAPPKPVEVEKVVEVVEEKPVVILDSDGDLVPDSEDKCPGTPTGARVNEYGCWTLNDVLFDFDKYSIKSQYYHLLDGAALVFEKNPGIKVEIEGNTDNMGPAEYNMALSLKRANAVRDYLIKKGVAEDRLFAKGYGFTRPVSTNSTPEGRALNRRVQLTPMP